MPDIHFDRFYRYDDLTRLLFEYQAEYPNLIKVESIGKSHEGREVWLVKATNFSTGPDTEKPALWVDGNIHATEVAASTANLYLIHTLVSQYGIDKAITECLDTRVFYIVPRVNPDGAEWALADRPKLIRSSTRPYPYDEDHTEGLIANEDIDGDGHVLMMRLVDPNGAWKVHPDDPRLLIRRDPVDQGGTYYRILPEGLIKNFDGVSIQVRNPREALDLNRNFPAAWRTENEQFGAGPYPTSEPEARNLVDFIVKHPNLTGVVTFHTFAGVLLRPYDDRADEEFPAEDLWTFKKIGDKGTSLTGYPNISTYHDFRYHPKTVTTGGFDTWMYDHLGMFSWTVEIWSPMRQAGLKDYKYIDWFREHTVEDDLKLLHWNDEKLSNTAFHPWHPFEHPQLGPVELGGWDFMNSWTNPPLDFLEKEVALFPEWVVWHLLISPKLALRQVEVTPLGEGDYRIRLVVENTGWLPSYVTKKAVEKKLARGVICEIELPEVATLVSGKVREELPQLEGRAYKSAAADGWEGTTDDRVKVDWVVSAPQGGKVKLTARHDRAGVVRAEVELKPGP